MFLILVFLLTVLHHKKRESQTSFVVPVAVQALFVTFVHNEQCNVFLHLLPINPVTIEIEYSRKQNIDGAIKQSGA